MALLGSITTIGGFTMGSRVLGFVRDILVAAILGAGGVADAFFVAFKLPNLFRRLFAEGAFNAAFVPQFAGLHETDGKAAARTFAEQALAVLLTALLTFVVLVQIFMPAALHLFAPGFVGDGEKFDLAVLLSRLTFPYLLFISLVSLMAGVLNSLGRFWAAAAAPILLNLSLIAAVLFLTPFVPTAGHALAWGVALAGGAQFLWLLVHAARAGFALRLRWPRLTPPVRKMLRRVVPGAVGAGVYQINLVIDTVIASLLPTGSISYLFFADRVNQLPLGVIGVAVGTALLPLMSRQLRSGDATAALASQNRAIEISLFLTLPAAVALMVIAQPVIEVLFQRGAFDAAAARATGGALAIYAAGLPAYVLIKAVTPGYFAREDTVTPVKIAMAAVAVNLVLNLILMGPLLHLGIATATAVSAWLNALVLIAVLVRRGQYRWDARLKTRLVRSLAASLGMGLILFLAWRAMGTLFARGTAFEISVLVALVTLGLAVYFAAALAAGAVRLDEVKGFLRRGGA